MDPKEICVLVSYDSNYASMAEITVQNNIKRYSYFFLYYDRIGSNP